jgi:hypothetical protein
MSQDMPDQLNAVAIGGKLAVLQERSGTPRSKRRPGRPGPGPTARVTVDSYCADPMYASITRAVAAILASGKVVAPVDVIVRMGWLSADDLEAWRFGRVPYLERVIRCNLTRLSRFLRILGFHCHDLNLTASQTAYVKWGKGRRIPLRFSKTGDAGVERVYARHFVWPGKGPFHPPHQRDDADDGST